jgi:hypothetical protein
MPNRDAMDKILRHETMIGRILNRALDRFDRQPVQMQERITGWLKRVFATKWTVYGQYEKPPKTVRRQIATQRRREEGSTSKVLISATK